MSVLNRLVSYYPSFRETKSGRPTSLLTLLLTEKHKSLIAAIRAETDPFKQKLLKEALPCYTVSGVFKERNNEGIISSSGLAAVDLDTVEDYDPMQVLAELKKIPFIAYCGLSCRGKRLYAIVPFLYPDKYQRHYTRLIQSFEEIGLPMGDSCHKSLSQPRFVSHNTSETQFFNHSAMRYYLLERETTYLMPGMPKSSSYSSIPNNPFHWCVEQINKRFTFSESSRHSYILQLARYCNLKGIEENITLAGCLEYVSRDFNEKEVKSIVKHIYSKQNSSFNKYPFIK